MDHILETTLQINYDLKASNLNSITQEIDKSNVIDRKVCFVETFYDQMTPELSPSWYLNDSSKNYNIGSIAGVVGQQVITGNRLKTPLKRNIRLLPIYDENTLKS